MDINLLVLNVGNSRLAIGTFIAGELHSAARVAHDKRSEWPQAIATAWNVLGGPDAAVAAAGVNPPLIEPLEHVVEQVTKQSIQWVGKQIDLPIGVLTDAPGETGVDRVLNVAAAYEQMGKACVVVDAGTAITIDCCNEKGDFLGGAIAPGVKTWLNALHEHTAKLPVVIAKAPSGSYGKSTEQAMLHGVYHGIRGMIKELVENYATDLGEWPDIIATGGDAKMLFEGWELIHAIAPDLTLYGIALAYANHHIRHGT
jgi:type III pantothenate kinase